MALDAMGMIGEKDRLHEISVRLDESHLAYLQLDESPQKLQARRKLEGYIKEYLCHVPNEGKYFFPETADILHRSAASLKDFSGYRACGAWSAISIYAANLLAQPWRKEYRTLRTYSGYYKHEIEANLIGAELMFELMGYKHTGLGVLALDGPIDPDKVSSVSRDAIVAFVECQIMKEIWENVSLIFTISWLDVLEFRWNFVGTAEQASRALNFRFLERMQQTREKSCSTSYRDYRHAQPLVIDVPQPIHPHSTLPYHPPVNNYNPTTMQNIICKTETIYPSDGNFFFPSMDQTTNSHNRCANPYAQSSPPSRYNSSAQTNSGNSTMQSTSGHSTRVPTGRLIELDTPLSVCEKNYTSNDHAHQKFVKSRLSPDIDEVDHRRHKTIVDNEAKRPIYAKIEKNSSVKKLSCENDEDSSNDDWSFVFKSLESLRYTKDLGERDDLMRKKDNHRSKDEKNFSRTMEKCGKSLTSVDRDDRYDKYGKKRQCSLRETNFNDGNVTTKENRSRDVFGSKKKNSTEFVHDSEIFSGDGCANEKTFVVVDRTAKRYSNTLPTSSRIVGKIVNETVGKNLEIDRDGMIGDEMILSTEKRWNCGFCTFLNRPGREICEMCGKSRRKGNEDKPLASGGKECPKCTLVNEKNASTCEACSASLKDSPTYI